MRRARISLLAGAAALLLAGCASAGSAEPTWVPSPGFGTNGEGPGVQLTPIIPVPSLTPPSNGPSRSPQPGQPSPSKTGKTDPLVVATHLTAPVGVTMMPDNTALVGERTTGRIVRVQPKPNLPVPTVRRLSGLDTSGGGGLLDLALSPAYDEDSLVYAYITTPTDNRVVDFTLKGPVTPVLTGIPKGRTGNAGRIAFDADGALLVGTGDAGKPALAANPNSLAGKVLRVSAIGRPAAGNPRRSSPVWTSGHAGVTGLCPDPDSGTVLETEPASGGDELNVLTGGDYYGYPTASGSIHPPLTTLPDADTSPGGCAVLNGSAYVTSLDGQTLLSSRLTDSGNDLHAGAWKALLTRKYGRLRTVIGAADGALWLTTSNKDGKGRPVADDERVIRYVPSSSGGGTNPA